MNRTLLTGLLALSLNSAFGLAFAADTSPTPTDTLASARAQIAAKNYPAAIEELKRVNEVTSADWNNLMGYSLRKQPTPDLAGSEKFYNEALRINPQHRGTLEYSGELYLMKGDLPMAEKRLAALDKACTLPCAEYTALKQSIARYKAGGGNKSTASDY